MRRDILGWVRYQGGGWRGGGCRNDPQHRSPAPGRFAGKAKAEQGRKRETPDQMGSEERMGSGAGRRTDGKC
jgi:hypothetical protein